MNILYQRKKQEKTILFRIKIKREKSFPQYHVENLVLKNQLIHKGVLFHRRFQHPLDNLLDEKCRLYVEKINKNKINLHATQNIVFHSSMWKRKENLFYFGRKRRLQKFSR